MGYAPMQAPPFAPKPKNHLTPKKDNPTKDAICHQCGKVGHWRRNCPIYLSELMKKKKLFQGSDTSGIFTIELYSFPSTSWVYDTGCGTHICITTQGLRRSRELKPGALSLYVGDGHRATIKAIGNYHLCLPSGLVLTLHNCYYDPSITRGIILVSRLYKDGFVNRFENDNSISVFKNNMIYFNAIPRDDIYEIVMSSSNTNESSMYAVTNKRAKLNLDSALLWHCRLGHINKKRIEKLQHDGLLDSTDIESFEKCVACMSGKMARKPYSHQVERAKDLLGLIHTDVCGPFKIMSRQGAYYFVTFTDDFSRYGYVYLLKHKHEVFETFKVFKKEVENQLGKTIKSLRSDRGGEYMSQEFLNHLKDHEIISHRTPPYTPQHNGVSERRNQTLLDMVRSMMSQTTLPKSFWDYALESAARILNMVPTKKVDKTPYKVWHGQAPKLSYLKVWGCEALVKRDTLTKPDKLEPEALKCIFVGYPKETMDHEASRSLEDIEIIQEEDTHPSLDTSLNHEEDDQEIDEPQSDINHIRRSTRTRRPTDRFVDNVDAKEHGLGDLDESMKDYEVWELVDIHPDGKNVAIAAFYDYEIWKIDVKLPSLMDISMKRVSCYTDAGYLMDADDMKSQTGYVFILNGGVVDWKSTKQSIFATSSTDAEYIAAFDASKEAVWIRKFIFGLGVVPTIEEPINMYCDNTGASNSDKSHESLKISEGYSSSNIETYIDQGVSAVKDPAGVDSAVKDPAGVDSAVKDSAGVDSADGVSTGSPSADSDPAVGNPADSFPPAGRVEPTDESNPAVSSSVSAEFNPVYADESTLPPGQQLGSSENTTRFPVPSDVCMDQISSGIFTSSSYDDDFRATLTNLAPAVEVNPVPTKRVNTIHPQSQILGDLASPVMTRSRAQKSKFGESAFIGYIQDQQRTNHTDQLHCLSACFLSQLEPTSIAKALEDPDWVDAMQEEMQQFINQQVWKLVPLPVGKHAIGTKWILKNKRDARGIVVRNKARLVAQGHRQEEGIDYDEVFAPVARIEAIRLFLAFASYMGFLVYQLDVKSAFLYGEIEEEVYVTQPKGFEDPYFPKHVYRVVKALYGLHQAPRAWDILLVQVYVDDIIFGSTNKAWCDEFEVLMKGEFEMSAMGEMTFFLGLQVKQLPDGLFISQDKYVKDMLTKFDMESVRTATTPYEAAKTKLKDETDPPVNVHLYRSMIGSLMYLTASRPDIMFAVIKKIFKYLKGQPKLGLWYPKDSPFQLEAYSDSDYAGSHGDRKSTTGGCQFLGRRLISWQCKKQTIVATSSTEAEYVAAASCCAQVLWIQNQLLDYGFNFMNTKIFIDNQSTICIVKNPVFHQRTKHIEIRHHFIRDANEKNLIQVLKIHTDDNVADLLTKAFDGPRFAYLVVHIGMVDMLVSAGCTMFLLVVILPAGRMVSAGCTMVLLVVILPAGRMVSAGCTMVLLVVILPAGCFVYVPAVCMVSAVGGLFLLAEYIHAAGVVYAANTSIHAAGLVCAGSIMFLLADLFLLVVTCFCCVQLDIAGWLVSATSHLVSAGSLHSCWCINVSAA
ncbi:putative ribonuclease H-like domain-containing protein [Tanacetum coccineum]